MLDQENLIGSKSQFFSTIASWEEAMAHRIASRIRKRANDKSDDLKYCRCCKRVIV